MKKLIQSTLVAGLALTLGLSSAQAETTWKEVQSKINSSPSYQLLYKYNGPQGNFVFDQAVENKGNNVRTEIKQAKSDPSKKGAVIVYNKSRLSDKVIAKVGAGMLTRNLTHKDVVGRPFHTGIYKMILNQIKSSKPKTSSNGALTVFKFRTSAGDYFIWANDNAEIVKTERKVGNVRETRNFSNIQWSGDYHTEF